MREGGLIRELDLQPRFPIVIKGQHVFTYVADFRYRDEETGEIVIEDVKGYTTPIYNLKKKCVEAEYGIEIREVQA